MLKKNKKIRRGFTLIEALVGIFLVAILSSGIYASYAFGLKMSTHNRLRTQATAIAEKKIEAIRAMHYDDIGIQGGIPAGTLLTTENEINDRTNFTIKTSVLYIDDPFDNKAPDDEDPADYKQIEVKVNWPTNLEDKSVTLDTLASPPGVQTNPGTGVLIVNSVDSEGNSISGCQVHLKNNGVTPAIDLTDETDSNGSLSLPGIPSSTVGYEITLSKNNYETIQTYPAYPISSFNPIDPHIAIAEKILTNKTFIIDKISHQNLHFADIHGTNLPNLSFSLKGGRIIGTTVEAAPKPVYSFDQSALTTDGEGKWNSLAISKGPYYFSITDGAYELVTTSLASPWPVAADSTASIEITMGNKTDNILVVNLKETGGETPIANATVKITDSAGNLFQETTSDINGIAYFPRLENPPKILVPGENYTIDATKDGYLPSQSVTSVSGITRKEIILTKQ